MLHSQVQCQQISPSLGLGFIRAVTFDIVWLLCIASYATYAHFLVLPSTCFNFLLMLSFCAGERKSQYVSLCCVAMAFSLLFLTWAAYCFASMNLLLHHCFMRMRGCTFPYTCFKMAEQVRVKDSCSHSMCGRISGLAVQGQGSCPSECIQWLPACLYNP